MATLLTGITGSLPHIRRSPAAAHGSAIPATRSNYRVPGDRAAGGACAGSPCVGLPRAGLARCAQRSNGRVAGRTGRRAPRSATGMGRRPRPAIRAVCSPSRSPTALRRTRAADRRGARYRRRGRYGRTARRWSCPCPLAGSSPVRARPMSTTRPSRTAANRPRRRHWEQTPSPALRARSRSRRHRPATGPYGSTCPAGRTTARRSRSSRLFRVIVGP